MSTPDPLDNLLLPYSVTLSPNLGTYGFSPWGSLTLPIGVVMVRFTWDGPESFRYRLDREVDGEMLNGQWNYVIEEADPGTPRSSQPIDLAVTHPTRIMCQINRIFPQETVDAGYRAGITVVPIARG